MGRHLKMVCAFVVCASRYIRAIKPNLIYYLSSVYGDADKSLARPGRKQARKHVRDARDFNNIETRAVIKIFFPAMQDAEGNSRHSDRNIILFPS